MNNSTQLFSTWIGSAKDRVKSAHTKLAADEEALTGINDPTNKGTVQIPSHNDGNNRKLLNLPDNTTNMEEPDKQHNIMDVTKPDGTGQGEYVTPRDGDARDNAATSPTAPLDKIAATLAESIKQLQAEPAQTKEASAPTPETSAATTPTAPAETQQKSAASGTFELPINLQSDASLMDKLASIGGVMLGTTEGQQAVAEALEREAGIKEASAIVAMVNQSMVEAAQAPVNKQASTSAGQAQQQPAAQLTEAQMQKIASDEAAHSAWINSYQTDIEKRAYAQGAADAEAMDAGMAEGGQPAIPGSDELSDEEILQTIQMMVESGEISQEDAEALLQALGGDGQVGGSLEQIAMELQQAVESGQISPEQAEAIAQQILADAGMAEGEAPVEGEPAPEEAEKVASVAQTSVNKTASVINDLFTAPANA